MPPSAPYAAQHTQQPFPALYLYPLNDSFIPKHISLLAGQRVKIGRQTNPKTAPGEKNGFFDSKVLSRQHAEIWEDNGKIFIKDVKSSNGTFINGERLSPEGVESDPYELKSDDIVEFGIDIVGEDNKTIIHHKVAARAVCVFSEQDAQVAARAEQHQQQQQQQQHLLQQQQQHQQPYPHALMGAAQPGPNMPSQFNFVGGPQQRRPAPNVGQGIAGIGGMGGSMRPPGKSGLTFEHILSRLQGELQKSRETGSELHSLTGSMGDIHQILGGNIPNIPPYPSALPPVRPIRQSSPAQSQQEQHPAPSSTSPPPPEQPSQRHQQSPQSEHSPPSSTSPTPIVVISQLQSQLLDTQTLLTKQVDKVRALEEVVADQDLMRKEVRDLRQLFETRSREIMFEGDDEEGQHQQQEDNNGLLEPRGGFDDHDDDDDIQHIRMLDEVDDDEDVDDSRSVHTIVPHELESVEEEDEEDVAEAERDHHPRIDEVDYADDRADPIDPVREREDESGRHIEDQHEEDHDHNHQMRKHENLNVGRPRTPEPSFGLREQPSSSSEINGHTKSPSLSISPNCTSPAMINSPRTRSGTLLAPRSPLSSPPSQPSETMPPSSSINGIVSSDGNDKMLEQILQLSAQMTAMAELAGNMEAQYVAAKDMIKVLEGKVEELEKMVRDEKEKEKEEPEVVVAEPEPPVAEKHENEEEEERKSLTLFFSDFKKSFEGQWNEVKEEWREERERLKRAREEWESKSKSLDVNLEKVSQLNVTTSNLVKDVQGQKNELMRLQERVVMKQQQQFTSGEIVRSGLVTPPSPRSQSSASGGEEEEDAASGSNSKGERRRRRKRSGSQRGQTTINVRRRNYDHDMMDDEEAALSDGATLASEGTGPFERVLAFAKEDTIASEKRLRKSLVGSALKNRDYAALSRSMFTSDDDEEEEEEETRLRRRRNGTLQQRDMLPTPASMVTGLSLLDEDGDENAHEDGGEGGGGGGGGRVGERKKVEEDYRAPPVKVNIQTAGAVIVLAVAAAAVFWKVKSE